MSKRNTLVSLRLGTAVAGAMLILAGCGQPGSTANGQTQKSADKPEPFASTYKPLPAKTTLITNATILTGTGERLEGSSILLENNKIAAIGADLTAPSGAEVIDAGGRYVTPASSIITHTWVFIRPQASAQLQMAMR